MNQGDIWTYEDEVLYYTFVVLCRLRSGQELAPVSRTFALMDPYEHLVASGPYRRQFFGSLGNAQYYHQVNRSGSVVLMGVTAIGNSTRRQRAEEDATLLWRPLDEGLLHVSPVALYFQSASGIVPWAFAGIDYVQMIDRCCLEFGGTADSGNRIQHRVASAWAELVLVLWAFSRNVPHAQFPVLFPPEWRARAQARGLAMPAIGP
jgi:hypothetical protein